MDININTQHQEAACLLWLVTQAEWEQKRQCQQWTVVMWWTLRPFSLMNNAYTETDDDEGHKLRQKQSLLAPVNDSAKTKAENRITRWLYVWVNMSDDHSKACPFHILSHMWGLTSSSGKKNYWFSFADGSVTFYSMTICQYLQPSYVLGKLNHVNTNKTFFGWTDAVGSVWVLQINKDWEIARLTWVIFLSFFHVGTLKTNLFIHLC